MNRYMNGDQTLFFALSIELLTTVSREQLIVACRESWLWLRYQIPIVACTIYVDGDDQGHLQYHSPTPKSASAWADRTFCVHSGLDLDALRSEVGTWSVPSAAGDQTWLHFSCSDSNAAHVPEFGLLFHSHHAPFDGTGVKLIMARFFDRLSQLLIHSSSDDIALQWGSEIDNLTPSVSDVLSDDEPLPIPLLSDDLPSFLHPYYSSLKQVNKTMVDYFQNDKHGFSACAAVAEGLPSCNRASLLLSRDDTSLLLKALKSIPSIHSYTVTHLAHAALSMVTIDDNPPSNSQSFLNNFSITNYRHRLHPEYTRSYTGYSLGTSIFRIPVSLFSAETANFASLDGRALANTMRFVRATYEAEKSIPAPLSTMGQLAELQAVAMKKAARELLIAPNHCYMFSSDGIGERHLPVEYTDQNGVSVMRVKSFFTSLNRVDPGPFFRISTWRGQMELSADYNSKAVDAETVKRHLDKWKDFMFLVTDIR
ncbi:hypothetical protein CPB85DRAFT_1398188 [Mucidula mucida]|nr:hypothetical protein CPB85DRAFT_1398188 [Mucidula mucida]